MKNYLNWRILTLLLLCVFGLSGLNFVMASAQSPVVKVCVDKKSKLIYYKSKCSKSESLVLLTNGTFRALSAYETWLQAGNTGTETDFLNSLKGEDGSNGRTTSVYDSLGTCLQKFNFAWNSQVNFAVKSQRQKFQQESSCNVEEINVWESPVKRRLDYGLPIISNIKFISLDPVLNVQHNKYIATLEITIRNYDALSGDQPLTFCNPYSTAPFDTPTNISGDRWLINAPISQTDNGLWVQYSVAFKKSGLCRGNALLGGVSINLNPQRFVGLGIYDRWLTRRGWTQ